eukprot:5218019-Pleurochrysis_carterae.AAC.4
MAPENGMTFVPPPGATSHEQCKTHTPYPAPNCTIWEPLLMANTAAKMEAHTKGILSHGQNTNTLGQGPITRGSMTAQCPIPRVISNAISGANMTVTEELPRGTELITGRCLRWIVAILFLKKSRSKCRARRGRAQSREGEKESRKETKGERRTRRLTELRRQVQKRIKNWSQARKLKYDGRMQRKYRNKVRASKRWLQQKIKNGA